MSTEPKPNLTYNQLVAALQTAVKENPSLGDRYAVIYQTDNWVRQVSHIQTGCGGDFIGATKTWSGAQ